MFIIDQQAYKSKLISIHPLEKFIFTIVTLLICLISQQVLIPLLILLLMSSVLLFYGKTSPKVYHNLMLLPLSFLLLGIIPIIIQIGKVEPSGLLTFKIAGVWFFFTKESIENGFYILLRSLGCVSCLYFLLLTTPMTEILSVLRILKVPSLFREMMLFIYRFIFVLMVTAHRIYTAQDSRGGYGRMKNAYQSFAQLVTMVFLKSYHRGQLTYTALVSRGYDGEIQVLDFDYQFSKRNWFLIAIIESGLLAVIFWGGM